MVTSCGSHSDARASSDVTDTGTPRPFLRWATAWFMLLFAVLLSGCGASSKTFDTSTTGTTGTTGTGTTATVTSISVEPANSSLPRGLTRQFTAIATYSNGTKLDVSASVTWASSVTNIASITATGVATGLNFGATKITAALGAVTGSATLTISAASLVSISVTPVAPTIAKGTLQFFTATGIYTDNSTQNITTSVTWSSSNLFVATISNAPGSVGLATGVSGGTSTITAALNGATGSTLLTVSGATLQSISVTPANPSISVGNTVQFTAVAVYSDGSTLPLATGVTWTSSSPAATISSTQGLATGVAVGTATISAAFQDLTGKASLQVTKSLVSITVTPVKPTIVNGASQQFAATGIYSDGSTAPLTTVNWTSVPSGTTPVATISAQGLATAIAVGKTLINASYTSNGNPITGSTTLTVINAFAYAPNIDCNTPAVTSTVSEYSVGPNGALTPIGSVAAGNCPFAIGITPNNAYAYVANSNGNNVTGGDTLSEYKINVDGTLSPLQVSTIATGPNPNSVNIDPSGNYVYVANFGGNTTPNSNTVSEFVIGQNGELSPNPAQPTVIAGNAPAAVAITSANGYAYVANLGDNSISQYTISNGVLTPIATAPTVTGGGLNQPNYIAVDPSGQYVYVPNLNGTTVNQYSIGPGGALAPLTPPIATTGSKPRYIAFDSTATGTYAYTADSFADQISQFKIVGGVLTPLTPPNVSTGVGSNPNGLTIDATGKYLYVADRGGTFDAISQFSIDPTTGLLTPLPPLPANNTVPAGTYPTNIATTP
jgi:6-phosphogluconolactonase (cycloisomerase 2 family)